MSDVSTALEELRLLAVRAGRDDLAQEAEAVRRDSSGTLTLVAGSGADASRLAGWIGRTVPDLDVRVVEAARTSDGLGKVVLVLRADRLVDAATQDTVADLSRLTLDEGLAVVATGAGSLPDLDTVGRGLGRVLLPNGDAGLADLPAHRIFLFEDGVTNEFAQEPLLASLNAFVAWLKQPPALDARHRAALGLRLLSTLEAKKDAWPKPVAVAVRALRRRGGRGRRAGRPGRHPASVGWR